MKIRSKLTVGFLACGLIPLAIAAVTSYCSMGSGMATLSEQAKISMQEKTHSALQAQQAVKKDQIEKYFDAIRDQILTFSEQGMVVQAMRELRGNFSSYREQAEITQENLEAMRADLSSYYTQDFSREYKSQNNGDQADVMSYFNQLDDDSVALQHAYIKANSNPLGSKHLLDTAEEQTDYGQFHKHLHPIVRSFLEKFGYYDIFLVDSESGDIVYSVFKELDYSTSLIDGPYAQTNFGEAFRKANQLTSPDEFVLVDFKQYTPSYEAPASFIASPIFDGDKKIGVAIFQMPVDRITEIMGQREGLGETGETILVGSDNLMRSNSFRDPEGHGLVNSFRNPEKGKVVSEAVEKSLAGEIGILVTKDYVGNETIQAYGPVDVLGLRWSLLAKMDTSEAFAAVERMEKVTASATATVLWTNIGIAVLGSIGVLFAAYFICQSFLKPILATVSSVEAAAQGDYSQHLDGERKDEFGQVGSAVNTMLTSLLVTERDFGGQIDAISKSQAVIEFNMDGTVITANENFLVALGYTLDEIQGQHHRMFVEPKFAECAEYKLLWEKLNRGEHEASEFKRLGKGGKEVWIQASYNPILSMKTAKPIKWSNMPLKSLL